MTEPAPLPQSLRFAELVPLDRWQTLQDHFTQTLALPLRTVDPERHLITRPSWPAGIPLDRCLELLEVGSELDRLIGPSTDASPGVTQLSLPSGVTYFALAIPCLGRMVATLVVGPLILGARPDAAVLRQRLRERAHDADAIHELLLTFKPYTFTGIKSVLGLLEGVGTTLIEFGYQTIILRKLFPEVPPVTERTSAFYLDRLLGALLEVATLATRADRGSAMVYHPEQRQLSIRAAHNLSETVVRDTKLALGEGLAGFAAATNRLLILDDATREPDIRGRMQRPELRMAVVTPLRAEGAQCPMGVLSLGTTDSANRFTADQIELIRKLVRLTTIAISGFSLSTP